MEIVQIKVLIHLNKKLHCKMSFILQCSFLLIFLTTSKIIFYPNKRLKQPLIIVVLHESFLQNLLYENPIQQPLAHI